MRTERYFTSPLVALASAVLATLFLIACQQSQQQPAPAAIESKAASTEKVFVVFEGPWAFVPDPKDANSVLALAPKAKAHRDLYVAASNNAILAAGIYDLSVPPRTAVAAGTFDPSFVRAKIDPQVVQRVLDDKSSNRYAIRLPRPEAYLPASRYRSRVSASYPPDPSTEKDHASAASLRYSVSTLNGFSLAGAPNTGTFNPLLLQVDTPTVRFVIEPAHDADECDTDSRQSFHDLVTLLALTLYVDFPGNPGYCHGKDPQNLRPRKAAVGPPSHFERIAVALQKNLADAQAASSVMSEIPPNRMGLLATGSARPLTRHLLAAVYFFFGKPVVDCRAPVIGG
jgi:hypothetical protein